jgi:hypothetical protein
VCVDELVLMELVLMKLVLMELVLMELVLMELVLTELVLIELVHEVTRVYCIRGVSYSNLDSYEYCRQVFRDL